MNEPAPAAVVVTRANEPQAAPRQRSTWKPVSLSLPSVQVTVAVVVDVAFADALDGASGVAVVACAMLE